MLILYHAANASCFIKCLLHRCIYHPNDEAVFIGYRGLRSLYFKSEKYKLWLDYAPMLGPFGNQNSDNPEEALRKICDLFYGIFRKYHLDLSDFNKIYIGSYYSEFAMYVNAMGKKHSIFEEAAGDWKPMEWSGYETFNAVVNHLNMKFYNNELVENRYGIFSTWPKESRSEKDINFEPYREIYHLNKADKQYFIEKFQLPHINFEVQNKNLLLLTQWFLIDGKRWENRDIVLIYKIILDYFIEDPEEYTVYIKPHPADPMKDEYAKINGINVIPAQCISELLGLIEGIHFKLAVTVSSTSIHTISEFTERTRQVGYRIVSLYPFIYKYHFAFVCLYKFLMPKKCCRFGIMDEEYEFLRNIPEISKTFRQETVKWSGWECADSALIVIHRMKWKENQEKFFIDKNRIDTDTVCVFLDIQELLNYAEGDISFIVENSIIFCLKKIDKETGLLEDTPEYIYCFCKNQKICNQLRIYSYVRNLQYESSVLKIYALDKTQEEIKKLLINSCREKK